MLCHINRLFSPKYEYGVIIKSSMLQTHIGTGIVAELQLNNLVGAEA